MTLVERVFFSPPLDAMAGMLLQAAMVQPPPPGSGLAGITRV